MTIDKCTVLNKGLCFLREKETMHTLAMWSAPSFPQELQLQHEFIMRRKKHSGCQLSVDIAIL